MTEAISSQNKPYEVELDAGSYWWCACGKTKTEPFCDGSHKGSEFAPLEYKAEADGPVWFCTCKRTQMSPECDGSHDLPT